MILGSITFAGALAETTTNEQTNSFICCNNIITPQGHIDSPPVVHLMSECLAAP